MPNITNSPQNYRCIVKGYDVGTANRIARVAARAEEVSEAGRRPVKIPAHLYREEDLSESITQESEMNKTVISIAVAMACCLLLVGSSTAGAQDPVNPERMAKVKKLMDLDGQTVGLKQARNYFLTKVKQEFPQLKEEFWQNLIKESDQNEMAKLIDKTALSYYKHLSDQEIDELIKFYETPVGQKVRASLLKITEDVMVLGEELGTEMAQRFAVGLNKEMGGTPPTKPSGEK
jgi:uncharacterized protein